MSEPIQLSDDQIIQFTQSKRKAFVDYLLFEGMPEETNQQTVLLTALADMDRTALGNKRIGSSEKQTAADALVARAISQLSMQLGTRNPFQENGEKGEPKVETDKLPEISTVPGELDVGLSDENYQNLISRFD